MGSLHEYINIFTVWKNWQLLYWCPTWEDTLTIDPDRPAEIIFLATIWLTLITCLTLALNSLIMNTFRIHPYWVVSYLQIKILRTDLKKRLDYSHSSIVDQTIHSRERLQCSLGSVPVSQVKVHTVYCGTFSLLFRTMIIVTLATIVTPGMQSYQPLLAESLD